MPLSNLSDAKLWDLIKQNNYRAFTALFKRHWLILYKTALFYIKDEERAEEIVHDLFLNLWNKRDHLEISNFKSYLKAATRYGVLHYLQKNKKVVIDYYETLPEVADQVILNKGEDHLLTFELEEEVNKQLMKLPARCREIFLMSRKEHLSNAEIAEHLGISKRSVENQITSALKFLRTNLKYVAVLLFALVNFYSENISTSFKTKAPNYKVALYVKIANYK